MQIFLIIYVYSTMIGVIGPYKDLDLCKQESEKLRVLTQQELEKLGIKNNDIRYECEKHLNRPKLQVDPHNTEKPGVLI